jgi:hypothetical protein
MWLDTNGNLIQILVLQNYLFFGNASSILNYIGTMFEEPPEGVDESFWPPIPKVIVLDLALVTGMDTSAVDVIADTLALLSRYECKLYLSGLTPRLRQVLDFGGVKPETSNDRSQRKLRLFPDLDTAIGKAEDMLLDSEAIEDDYDVRNDESGFRRALRFIDELVRHMTLSHVFCKESQTLLDETALFVQHKTSFMNDLLPLEQHMTTIDIDTGDLVYDDDMPMDRGLFFIERGVVVSDARPSFETIPFCMYHEIYNDTHNYFTLVSRKLSVMPTSVSAVFSKMMHIDMPA